MAGTKVSLKLLVDTSSKKVLFAEAEKEFVDFLFGILALPIGTVIKLLTAKKMAGCLGNLYESIENLNAKYMQPKQCKDSILNPQAPIFGAQVHDLLLPNTGSSATRSVYKCVNYKQRGYDSSGRSTSYLNCRAYVADDPRSLCPNCKSLMSSAATYVAPPKAASATDSSSSGGGDDEGGYVKGVISYMVMDDLVVKPMSTISSIALLNQCNVKDLGSLQEKEVELGMEEGIELLRASLMSKTVLTDVFFSEEVIVAGDS